MLRKILRFLKDRLRRPIRLYMKSKAGKINVYNLLSRFRLPQFNAAFKNNKPQLNDLQKSVLQDLNRDGIATLRFQDLFSEQELLEVKAYYENIKNEKRFQKALRDGGNNYKDYIIMASKFNKRIDQDNILFKVGTSHKILDIVNSYLETYSKALNFDVWHTLPSDNTERKFSQNWHRDPEDGKLVKIFLYLNDVDSDGGPFSYIKGSHAAGKYGKLWPKAHPAIGIYPSSEEIYKEVNEADIIENTGKEGTLILCDTNGVHRGGFGKKTRILAYWVYAPHSTASERRNKFILRDENSLSNPQKALFY